MQFSGVHINFFDKIRINIGTFSANSGTRVSSGKPGFITEQYRIPGMIISPITCSETLVGHEISQRLQGKTAQGITLPFLTYDASGCPGMLDTSKGAVFDCYV